MAKKRSLRARVSRRAKWRCEYCRAPQTVCGYPFHLDHIRPASLGGSNGIANRALACSPCNLAKSNQTSAVDPKTKLPTPLFNPRKQKWAAHFAWHTNQVTILALTPTGRATRVALKLNQRPSRSARPLWFQLGLLP